MAEVLKDRVDCNEEGTILLSWILCEGPRDLKSPTWHTTGLNVPILFHAKIGLFDRLVLIYGPSKAMEVYCLILNSNDSNFVMLSDNSLMLLFRASLGNNVL